MFCFFNIRDVNIDLKHNEPESSREINDSNLYNCVYWDKCTLLQGSTKERMIRYSKLLVFYGFDFENAPFGSEESAWKMSMNYPSEVHTYFESVLVKCFF